MAKVYCFGDLDVSKINDMNVPMNIFIEPHTFSSFTEHFEYSPFDDFDGDSDEEIEDIKNDDTVYVLTACNYTPRRENVISGAYAFMSTDKQELINIVQKHIVPLYEIALLNLKADSTNYYWQRNDESGVALSVNFRYGK